MVERIAEIKALPDLLLDVSCDDGKRVIYDVKDDLSLPGYTALRDVFGLFSQVQLDESRTCVFWNDYIDLPSHAIYEYGKEIKSS